MSDNAYLIVSANGFSIAEGFKILGPSSWFEKNFPEFAAQGISSPMMGLQYLRGHAFTTFYDRLIKLIHFDKPQSEVMGLLKQITQGHDTFILTANIEDRYAQAGFDRSQIFEMEGRLTFDQNHQPISRAHTTSITDPNQLETFDYVESPHFQERLNALREFVSTHPNLTILELGVGTRNGLLRPVVFQIMEQDPKANLVIFNMEKSPVPPEFANRTTWKLGPLEPSLKDWLKSHQG